MCWVLRITYFVVHDVGGAFFFSDVGNPFCPFSFMSHRQEFYES